MVEELVFCVLADVMSDSEGRAILEALPVLHWQ